jgi:Domain of Unknown Function (DUF1080)/Tetratricopeptide repeat
MAFSAADVERLLQAARLHLAQGELHDAVGRATEAIRLDGKEPAAYLVRAEAHRRLNRPDRAVADLAVAIRFDSNQPGPYVIRAQILLKRCLFDQAIADATNAIILDARSAAAYSIRAECRSAIGDKEGATEDVHEMLRIDPTRSVPDLRPRSVSGDTSSPAVASDDERFWKQSGETTTDDERAMFADGKPVDKTYRSRRVVSDEDAPETLGVASGYRPETIAKPLPRIKAARRRSNFPWLWIGIGIAGAGLVGYLAANRGRVAPDPVKVPSPPQIAAPEPTIASSQPSVPTTPKSISSVPSASPRAMNEPPERGRNSDPNKAGAPEKKTILLIQGDTLDGWHPQPWADRPQWEVKNGVLKRVGNGPSLVTNDKFKDFDLHLEFSLPPQGNSGVFLRGRYEVQLLDSAWRSPKGKPERPEGQCGSIYGLIAPSRITYRGANQWNTLDVRLVGQIVTVRMNNETLIDKQYIPSVTVGALDTDESSPGSILLQAHVVIGAEFRNITITPIP